MADLSQVAVIFDLDGTLADTAPDIHATANRVMAGFGFGPLSFATVQGFVGRGLPNLVARLLETHGATPDGPLLSPAIARFETEYLTAHDLTRLYPGVREALRSLVQRGAQLAICTNKPHGPALALLGHLGLLEAMALVIGGDSLAQRKPHPGPLLHCVQELGRARAVYVGDSEVDAETAQAAGVPFALFTEGYRHGPVESLPHHRAFADFKALPDIVADMIAAG